MSGLADKIAERLALAKEPGDIKSVTITFANGRGTVKYSGDDWCGKDVRACFSILSKGYRRRNADLLRERKEKLANGPEQSGADN